jgi:hypothetical protein
MVTHAVTPDNHISPNVGQAGRRAVATGKKSRKQPNTPRSRVKNAIRQVWLRSRERQAVVKAQKNTCQICGVKGSTAKDREVKIQVHHLDGIDWDGVVDLIFDRVLRGRQECRCVACHDKEHKGEVIHNA